MKKLFYILMLGILGFSNTALIKTEEQALEEETEQQEVLDQTEEIEEQEEIAEETEEKPKQDHYYACMQSLGVAGVFYQEYATLEECHKSCHLGACIRVDQPKDRLDTFADQALVRDVFRT